MGKNLNRANIKDVAPRTNRDSGEFSVSPDIDNSGRGVLRIRNVTWELNDKYVSAGDLNIQRSENGGLTDVEIRKFQFSAYEAIYHPTNSASESFARPSSWSSSVNIVMPAGYAAGKTITGNDGQQYIEMRDSVTGEVVSHLGQYSCTKIDSDVFNPLKKTTQSLRDEGQHFEINYKIGTDGKITRRSETEVAFREMMIDLDNSATKLPNQLDMITIITNDVLASNNPKFQSAAKAEIKTPVAPVANFSGVADGVTAPVQSVVMNPKAKPAPRAAQNEPRFALEA